jgi:hypothetical protein
MEESATHVATLFEEMMRRFDAQTMLIEKKFEDQRSFNDEVALEVVQPGCRVAADLLGKSVQTEADLASPRLRPQGDPPLRPALYPVLTNNGPPVLEQPARQSQRNELAPTRYPPPSPVEPVGYTKPPKHDFPRFSGELPRL